MNKLQATVLMWGAFCVVAANLPGAIPSFWKSGDRSVGLDAVSVYRHTPGERAIAVPVLNSRMDHSETGQHVAVYLDVDYQPQSEHHWLPRVNLLLVFGWALLFGLAGKYKGPDSGTAPGSQKVS